MVKIKTKTKTKSKKKSKRKEIANSKKSCCLPISASFWVVVSWTPPLLHYIRWKFNLPILHHLDPWWFVGKPYIEWISRTFWHFWVDIFVMLPLGFFLYYLVFCFCLVSLRVFPFKIGFIILFFLFFNFLYYLLWKSCISNLYRPRFIR